MTMNLKKLGARLKHWRQSSGFKQQSIADYLKVDQSYVSKWESGERPIDTDKLEALAALYGCTTEAFLTESAVPKVCEVAFRADALQGEDLHALAGIKRIMLNQAEMEQLSGGTDNVKQ